MHLEEIIAYFESQHNQKNIDGMARFGIVVDKAHGVPLNELRLLAKRIGKNHDLAWRLWATGIHDARLLAIFVEKPALVNKTQMDRWVREFDSWDICDGCCVHLFRKTPFAFEMAERWTKARAEYIRRAGFALLATLAVHEKATDDAVFLGFFHAIRSAATDERNFVKKAVNWALRQIGKKNLHLHEEAIKCAAELIEMDSKSSRWIGRDALRELQDPKIVARIKK
jgi:3-methyladenine DNA glycosylase AlkD